MLFTQRLLWGKKGLFRATNIAPLTKAQREKGITLAQKTADNPPSHRLSYTGRDGGTRDPWRTTLQWKI